MTAIRNYTDTLIEFKIAKARLDYLLLRREELEVKYCGVKGISYKTEGGQDMPSMKDNMMEFIVAITTPDEDTGLSLDDEIEEKTHEVIKLYELLASMARSLSKLSSLEGQLYYLIVIEGRSVSKAVEQVAELNYMEARNVWKTYYPKIQPDLMEIRKSTVKVQ